MVAYTKVPAGATVLAVSPRGSTYAVAHGRRVELHQLQPQGETVLASAGAIETPSDVTSLAVSDYGEVVYVGGKDGAIRAYSVKSKTQTTTFAMDAPVTALVYVAEQARLFAGNAAGRVVLWDAAAEKEVRRLDLGGAPIHALAYNNSLRSDLWIAQGTSLAFWPEKEPTKSPALDLSAPITSLATVFGGNAAVSTPAGLQIVDHLVGEKFEASQKVELAGIVGLASDTNDAFSATSDGTIRYHHSSTHEQRDDVKRTRRCRHRLRGRRRRSPACAR
jgi:WD40 repeat protein